MAQLIVRNLEDDLKTKLQERARRHGQSTEEEVRDILCNALRFEDSSQPGLGTRIAARFAEIGLEEGEDNFELRGHPARPAEVDP